MVHPVILRIGKRFPKPIRSAIYLSLVTVQSKLTGAPARVGENSGTAETATSLWAGRAAVRSGEYSPWAAGTNAEWPAVDITAVTYNSAETLDEFFDSLLALDYPLDCVSLFISDNSSTDDTKQVIERRLHDLQDTLQLVAIQDRPNNGFGAGQNAATSVGSAPFILATNVDLQFEPSALRTLVGRALSGPPEFASWEARQFPFEHPKSYDPITMEVAWSSHCCVLLRREAFELVGRYDERIFLYGEDVELSFRLRRHGYRLAYVPTARVLHFALDSDTRDAGKEHFGGVLSNGLLRLRYGDTPAQLVAPLRIVRLSLRRKVSMVYRAQVLHTFAQFVRLAPAFACRPAPEPGFPIRGWDYELARPGVSFDNGQPALPRSLPLVSIITRTIGNRTDLLIEAMASVANQTYPNIEHVIVEDGGEQARQTVDSFRARSNFPIVYVPTPKLGRCGAGNAGMSAASGEYFVFLDDDDLLFADHVECLARKLIAHRNYVAAYSWSWEAYLGAGDGRDGPELDHRFHAVHHQAFDATVLEHHNFMTIQSVMFNRRLFEERGGFRVDLDILEDWNLWIRYAAGNRFGYVPQVTSMYRTPGTRRSREKRRRSLSDAYESVLFHNEEDVRRYRNDPIELALFVTAPEAQE